MRNKCNAKMKQLITTRKGIKTNNMKTAASYIKKKYDCYKDYSEQSIRDVCHIWCEVIEEAQNDVKKEYEEKLRWIPVEEKLPELREKQYQVESMSVAGTRSQWTIESEHDIESLKGLRIAWRYFL